MIDDRVVSVTTPQSVRSSGLRGNVPLVLGPLSRTLHYVPARVWRSSNTPPPHFVNTWIRRIRSLDTMASTRGMVLFSLVSVATATVYLKEDFSGDCAHPPLKPCDRCHRSATSCYCGRGEPLGCERLEKGHERGRCVGGDRGKVLRRRGGKQGSSHHGGRQVLW